MKKTWKKLAAIAVTTSMAICGGVMSVSAAAEETPEKVTVNVAYMPDYSSLNGLISAVELGYFEDENIDVELWKFKRPEMKFDSVEHLKNQMQADIAFGKEYFFEK